MTVVEAVTVLAASAAFLTALAGAFVSVWNAVHLAQVHTIVNSQSTKFQELQRLVGYGEGQADERAGAQAAVNVKPPFDG